MKIVVIVSLLIANVAFANYDKSLYGEYKIGNPYKIGGKTYSPRQYSSYNEDGFISWYGPGFHNKKTSNGATFNQNAYTVAHRTLPMPSIVEITNFANGKKVIAVVNDRGPFSESQHRILDVSKKIAEELDFINEGIIRGSVRLLAKETEDFKAGKSIKLGPVDGLARSNVKQETKIKSNQSSNQKGTYVQIGAFESSSNAQKVLSNLKEHNITNGKVIKAKSSNGKNIEIVRVGPLQSKDESKMLSKIHTIGYKNAKILIVK